MKNSKISLPIKLNRAKVLFLCTFSLLVYFIMLLSPYVFKYVIDNIQNLKGNKLYLYVLGAVLFAVFAHGLSYLCDYLNQVFCNENVLSYQKEVVKKISTINTPDYEKMNKAKTLNLLNYDISVIYTYINLKVDLVIDLIKILVLAIVLLKINYILALITFVLIPVYYVGNYFNKNRMENLAR